MSALEMPKTPESIKTPDTPEEMIAKYLAYADTATPDQIENRVKEAFRQPNAHNYAEALRELANREGREGMQKIVALADSLKEAMLADARKLELPVSPFARDRSWAMWDIGKQYYLFQYPEETTDVYRDSLADPFAGTPEAEDKQREIVNRRLGWEAYRSYHSNRAPSNAWKEKVSEQDDEIYTLAMGLLQKKPEKSDGQLHSYEYAKLGDILHNIAQSVEKRHADAPPAVKETAAKVHAAQEPIGLQTLAPEGRADAHAEETIEDVHAKKEHIGLQTLTPEEPAVKRSRGTERVVRRFVVRRPKAERVAYVNRESHRGVTIWGVTKATGLGMVLLPFVAGWLALKEFGKMLKEAFKNMWGVTTKLAKSGFSFKALNKSVEGGGGGGHSAVPAKKEEPKHEKKDDHGGHGGHGGGHH